MFLYYFTIMFSHLYKLHPKFFVNDYTLDPACPKSGPGANYDP